MELQQCAPTSGEIAGDMEAGGQTRTARAPHRLVAVVKAQSKHVYRQFRILLRALRHPDVPWYSKLVCGCVVLYVCSPIQLIPNFIPVIGQMDDVFVIAMAIKLLKKSAPAAVLEDHPKPIDAHKVAAEDTSF